jgi:hypothetical protein
VNCCTILLFILLRAHSVNNGVVALFLHRITNLVVFHNKYLLNFFVIHHTIALKTYMLHRNKFVIMLIVLKMCVILLL